MAAQPTRALRVGVVLGGARIPAWFAEAVERVAALPDVELVAIGAAAGRSPAQTVRGRLDRLVFGRGRPDPFELVDAPPVARSDGGALDVVLRLDDPSEAPSARFGAWTVELRGAVGELVATTDTGRVVVCRSVTSADPLSAHRTRARSAWKAAAFPARALAELSRRGTLAALPPSPAPPTAGLSLTEVARRAQARWRPLHWFVGYRRREESEWRVLDAPGDRFYADPFPFEHDGVSYLFFEDYDYRAGSAVISVVELAEDGSPGPVRVALDTGHHLSYPFVFAHGGDVFLVPEGVESGQVRLYRATRVPDRWELHAVLLDAPAADPTVVRHDGRWWLFANLPEPGAPYEDELSLYVADRLEGPWTPHPRNPVVSDVRGARGAGRVFERDGVLLRPGQDAATEELAVVLHAVDALTPEEYAEHAVERVDRSWHPDAVGAHTYNESEHWVAVDGYRRPLKLRWTRRVR